MIITIYCYVKTTKGSTKGLSRSRFHRKVKDQPTWNYRRKMETAPPLVVNPATAIQVNQPSSYSHTEDRKRLPYFNSKVAVATGIMQISCGVLAIVLEIIYLKRVKYLYPLDKASVGIWGGARKALYGTVDTASVSAKKEEGICTSIGSSQLARGAAYYIKTGYVIEIRLFVLTGVLGIFSAKKKRGMVIVYFVLSIICIVTALVGLLFAISHIQTYRWTYDPDKSTVILVVSTLSLIVYVIEELMAIVACSFGCAARICCDGQAVIHERVIYMPTPQCTTHGNDGFHLLMGVPPSYLESISQVTE